DDLILIVDDDIGILELTRLNLEAYDFSVLTASEGTAALALYAERRDEIKAVVTDLRMPILGGLELIAKLREINPSVKIIGISGQDACDAEAKAARPFLQAFLSKPFSREALLEALRVCLGPTAR
ncbi:MAG TPA: response regulator, partial [Candidatus Saccharimonadales bacterium]|nr:response regulator [Candidatus Saccharimonadales bacterium]